MALISILKRAAWIALCCSWMPSLSAQIQPLAPSTVSHFSSSATNGWRSTGEHPDATWPHLYDHTQLARPSLSANGGWRTSRALAPSPIRRKASALPLAAYFQASPQAQVSAYRYQDLALFCKLEVLMERRAGLPIKVRLGEVNAVEKLEGKPYTPFLVR